MALVTEARRTGARGKKGKAPGIVTHRFLPFVVHLCRTARLRGEIRPCVAGVQGLLRRVLRLEVSDDGATESLETGSFQELSTGKYPTNMSE